MAFFIATIATVHAATIASKSAYTTCLNNPATCLSLYAQRSRPASQVPTHAVQGAVPHDSALSGNTLRKNSLHCVQGALRSLPK